MKDKTWLSVRKKAEEKIMSTNILCEILSSEDQEEEAVAALETVFEMMRDFEKRFSRFRKDNELFTLNHSARLRVSEDLFAMLTLTKRFHESTQGLFDPSVLSILEKEGYGGAFPQAATEERGDFSKLRLDAATRTVTKPAELLIDLGGIGKGYIVDRATHFLSRRFDNFLIDAGGDIFAKGSNEKEGYPYWAIEVEHPLKDKDPIAILLLKDMAVATSGRNRRHWKKEGEEKHHLIDPALGRSAPGDFLTVTVLAEDTTTADILAKSLFIAGKERGSALAEAWEIPAIFVEADGSYTINQYAKKYVWNA
jgi:FAD:protein FMN transferase